MANHRKNYDEAVRMYELGMSIGDVADFHNVSRQSMYDSLKRRGVAFRSRIRIGADNVFYRGGRTQCLRSRQLVALALEKGELINPQKCEDCKNEGCRIEGHHDDYTKPLEVRWLCHKCHYEWHVSNIPKKNFYPDKKLKRHEICSLGGKSTWAKVSPEEKAKRMEVVRGARLK